MHGGGHERGMRSGTLNVPGIVGFGKAAEVGLASREEEARRLRLLRRRLSDGLISGIDGVTLNGPALPALSEDGGLAPDAVDALVGALGNPIAVRAARYTDRPLFGIDRAIFEFAGMRMRTDLLIAGAIGLMIFVALSCVLYRTWTGRSFRAVSMDRQAAAVVGIDPGAVFLWAFGIGTALASLAGAALVPAFNFQVPEMAAQTAIRSYVIVVLGGLGSLRGALLGALFLGVVEALTAGCYPDPSKGATYQVTSGLLVFLAVLLVRPQGFFGRAET